MYSDILLTVDFDRTLTAPDSTVPARNLQAIEYFIAHGGAFTLNTGRSIPMCHNIFGKIPTNAPLILYNGSAACDGATGQLSQCRIIDLNPRDVAADLQERFPALTLEVQGRDAHYAFRKNPGWEAYSAHNHCPWAYCQPEEIPGPFLKFSLYGEFRDKTVAAMYEGTDWELALFEEASAYITKEYGHKVELFRPCARILDMHAKGTGKGYAARELQRSLGRRLLVCVGDAENDLNMLQNADFAFCPADGVVADRFPNVCNCADGAIADVIYEKIPKILKMGLDK